MNNKVCHITCVHRRYDVRIFEKECLSLVQNGYDVTLVVNDNLEDEIINGIKIVSTHRKPKRRILRLISSKKNLLDIAIASKADIIHLHDPELLTLGNILKKKGKVVIFDSHEDVPLQIYDKPWIPRMLKKSISKVYEQYEKYSVKKYDAVVTVTPHIATRFLKINTNTILITNYPRIHPNAEINRRPEDYICFTGGIVEEYNHDKILLALKEIRQLRYLLAGAADEKYLRRIEKISSWDRVDYLGHVDHSQVNEIFARSFAGMALNFSNQAKAEGSMGVIKLFEYMEAGLPVICTNYPIWVEIVEKNRCGICVDTNDIKGIISAITYLRSHSKEAIEMGQNGRSLVLEKYNWASEEEKLINLYTSLAKLART